MRLPRKGCCCGPFHSSSGLKNGGPPHPLAITPPPAVHRPAFAQLGPTATGKRPGRSPPRRKARLQFERAPQLYLGLVQPIQVQQRGAQDANRVGVPRRQLNGSPGVRERPFEILQAPQNARQVHVRLHEIGLLREGLAVSHNRVFQRARLFQAEPVVQQAWPDSRALA